MPVFDFSSIPENEKKQDPVCTYTMFRSNEAAASPEKPILILEAPCYRCLRQSEQTHEFRIQGRGQQCLC